MPIQLPDTRAISEGATRTFGIDLTDELAAGETLSSVDSLEEQDTSDLTIAGEAVTNATYTDPYRRDTSGDLVTVAIGKAFTFQVSGALQSTGLYTIRATVTTSTGDVLVFDFVLLAV